MYIHSLSLESQSHNNYLICTRNRTTPPPSHPEQDKTSSRRSTLSSQHRSPSQSSWSIWTFPSDHSQSSRQETIGSSGFLSLLLLAPSSPFVNLNLYSLRQNFSYLPDQFHSLRIVYPWRVLHGFLHLLDVHCWQRTFGCSCNSLRHFGPDLSRNDY